MIVLATSLPPLKDPLKCGVYSITHIESGKRYIGSSWNVPKRFGDHKRDLKNNKHHSSRLQNAWNKYGEGVFEFSQILICAANDRLFYEQLIMDEYKVVDRAFGYNTRPKAESNFGHKFSKEFCEKISRAKKGKPTSKKGKHYPLDEETRKRLSAIRRGREPWNKGIPISDETKQKLSAALKGRTAWNNGIPFSQESKERLSNSQRIRCGLPETREKYRLAKLGTKCGPYKSGNAVKTHCPKGHPYSGENLYIHPNANRRSCKACGKASSEKKRVGVL